MRKSRRAPERSFLDQHDVEARRRENLRGDAAARARADDRDVRLERQVALEGGGVGDLPARRESGADRIADHPSARRTGVADRRPAVGARVPRRQDELVQRVIRLLEQGPAAEPPALQERSDVRGGSLRPRRRSPPRAGAARATRRAARGAASPRLADAAAAPRPRDRCCRRSPRGSRRPRRCRRGSPAQWPRAPRRRASVSTSSRSAPVAAR